MKTHFVVILILMTGSNVVAQWTGQSSSSDLTSPISRTGSLSLTGTGSFLNVTSRIGGGSNGNILFQNGTDRNLILSEMSANNWAIGYGLTPGSVPTPVISWSTTNNVAFAGNVAIGIPNPSSNLHINNGSGQTTLRFTSGIKYGSMLLMERFNQTGVFYALEAGAGANDDLRLHVNNNWSTPIMSFKTDGSVGIGTASPGSFKLAVEGKIGAREINVTTAAWSDYVFQEDYKLRPLEEVNRYIKENKHLPEVPSANEVIANGQNLGEMNMLLLKKIEELTLYVIEQNKKIEDLSLRDLSRQKEIENLTNKK